MNEKTRKHNASVVKHLDDNPKYYETAEFLRCRDEWYAKVEDTDIEAHARGVKEPCRSGGIYLPLLKRNGYEIEKTYREDVEDYFRSATGYLYDGKFKSKTERYIWERHSLGVKIPDIMNERTKSRLSPVTYWRMYRIIRVIRERMSEHLNKLHNEAFSED